MSDIGPFGRDDEWLGVFGPIMVRWPLKPRTTFDENWITRGVVFKDGVRVDFQITDLTAIERDRYDSGFRVLVDKDDLTTGLSDPTFSEHNVRKPSREEYETLVREFWWNATYVPKHLWRDELPFAAMMLGESIRSEYLRTIIDWHIGLQNDWSVSTGIHGRKIKRLLDADTWSQYEATFATAGIEEHWEAFFAAIALFSRLARVIGIKLGYHYPAEMEREMTGYYTSIRNTKPAAE